MTEVIERLKTELGALPSEERAELASFLLQTLGPEEDDGVDAAVEAEVARRVEEIHSGRAIGVPTDVVFAKLRERYP